MRLKPLSFLLAGILLIAGTLFYSCTKESTTPGTKTDTVLTRTQILTQKTWQVDQLIHVISGVYSTYTRGGTNGTGTNYDNLRFTFKADGTGTHTDAAGSTYPTTWQFSTTDQRTLKLAVNGTTYTWNMVELSGNYMHATAGPLTVSGNSNNMESFRLIQIP